MAASLKRPRTDSGTAADLTQRISKPLAARDGARLYAILRSAERTHPRSHASAARGSGPEASASLVDALARASVVSCSEGGLEVCATTLKYWSSHYASQEDRAGWMILPFAWLCSHSRKLATSLDKEQGGDRYQTKLVEVLRERFQHLHREPLRREGCLAVCVELLRLYFSVGQAAQCSFLLAAMVQAHGGKPNIDALPKGIAVTLCFLWGRHCVMNGQIVEAEEKLAWAFVRCPLSAAGNRRRILTYLVPCRLRLGRFPSKALVDRTPEMDRFTELAAAVADGNIQRFDKEFKKQETALIHTGTYLVVEKLRVIAYRNLCRVVYGLVAAEIDRAGRTDHRHKQNWKPYEDAFAWQDGFDCDETICMLANLIYIGAIRGYMSDEHRKIVFSKDAAFPPLAVWAAKI